MNLWDEVSKCRKIVFLASGGLESEKDIKNLLTVRVEPLARVCARDLHMKQEESCSHPEDVSVLLK